MDSPDGVHTSYRLLGGHRLHGQGHRAVIAIWFCNVQRPMDRTHVGVDANRTPRVVGTRSRMMQRRSFLIAITCINVPLTLMSCTVAQMTRNALSSEVTSTNPVDPSHDKIARSIKYVETLSKEHPAYGRQSCLNCAHYASKGAMAGWGRCTFLTSGLVSKDGWCTAWSKSSPYGRDTLERPRSVAGIAR